MPISRAFLSLPHLPAPIHAFFPAILLLLLLRLLLLLLPHYVFLTQYKSNYIATNNCRARA